MSAEKIDALKEKRKQYYQKNKFEICKKTIKDYCERSIERVKKTHFAEVKELYAKFPYERYDKRLIKKVIFQYGIKLNMYEYTECVEAGFMAYMYCISRFAVINCINVEAYLNKVVRIYIKCALVICRESLNICKENNFKLVEIDNVNNVNKW